MNECAEQPRHEHDNSHLASAALKLYEEELDRKEKELNKLRLIIRDCWLKKGEAAKYLGVSPTTLWRMQNDGCITFHNNRAKKSDLDRAMKIWEGKKNGY